MSSNTVNVGLLKNVITTGAFLVVSLGFCGRPLAMEPYRELPVETGLSISLGHTYNPGSNRGQFLMATGILFLDHLRFPPFPISENFRFKLEASLGKGVGDSLGFMASGNFLSLYYLDAWANDVLRPYIEAGVGVLVVEKKWFGQGTSLNFNPVAGVGVEFASSGDKYRYFISGRLFHASNAGLHKNNRGLNVIVFSTGVIF